MPQTYIVSQANGTEPGKYLTSLFEAGGPRSRVFLAARSVWALETAVFLRHDDTELATLDHPEDDEEKAVLQTVGKGAMAINSHGLKRTRIRSLVVDGMEPKFGRADDTNPLVAMAGPGSEDQLLEDCVLKHTRGWTCCHVTDHGLRPRVIRNKVGPAGHPAPKGPWADGISVACRDGIIAGNTIVDATDGCIVLFCAEGTLVVNNTIIARTREALGAINLVDYGIYDGDYTNTRVFSNRISSAGAFIRLGIGIGSRPWGGSSGVGAFGGLVCDNSFGPGEFGYAMAVGGAKDFTVQGNRIHPRTVFQGQAAANNPAAQAFVKFTSPREPGGNLQEDFVEGFFAHLIGIEPGLATSQKYYAGGFVLKPGPGVSLRSARLELLEEGKLVLWDEKMPGRVLWSSQPKLSASAKDVEAKLTKDGILEIRDGSTNPLWASSQKPLPLPYPGQPITTAAFTISETAPYLSIQKGTGDTLFLSPPRHISSFTLASGQFISLSDTTAAWLILDPKTSALVLHTSAEPLDLDETAIVWKSPLFGGSSVEWDGTPEHQSKAVLQGDSNLVIYAYEKGAIWATRSNGKDKLPFVALYGPDEPGGMRLDLLGEDLKPRWSSKEDVS